MLSSGQGLSIFQVPPILVLANGRPLRHNISVGVWRGPFHTDPTTRYSIILIHWSVFGFAVTSAIQVHKSYSSFSLFRPAGSYAYICPSSALPKLNHEFADHLALSHFVIIETLRGCQGSLLYLTYLLTASLLYGSHAKATGVAARDAEYCKSRWDHKTQISLWLFKIRFLFYSPLPNYWGQDGVGVMTQRLSQLFSPSS